MMSLCGLYIIVVRDGLYLNAGDLGMVAGAIGFAFYVLQVGKFCDEQKPMPAVIFLMAFCAAGVLFCACYFPMQKLGILMFLEFKTLWCDGDTVFIKTSINITNKLIVCLSEMYRNFGTD